MGPVLLGWTLACRGAAPIAAPSEEVSHLDEDGDGFSPAEGDCADDDASVGPTAAEICGDGRDNNCNGQDVACLGSLGGDLMLRSVEDVESFCLFYDGIDGDLVIEGTSLASLDGLACLRSVGGSITLADNAALESVWGLRYLSEVGAALTVAGNPFLEELDGLGSLRRVGTALVVSANDRLRSTTALDALTVVGSEIAVVGNPALQALDLPALVAVPTLRIEANATLGALAGFDRLSTLDRVLVSGHENLERVEGFGAVDELAGLSIEDNLALASLDGFGGLVHLGEYGLVVERNPALVALRLPSLVSAGPVSILDDEALVSVALPALRSADGFAVGRAPVLETLDALELRTVKALAIGRTALRSLDGLSALERVAGSLSLDANPMLASTDDLAALVEALTVDVIGHASLDRVELPALVTVQRVTIADNPALREIVSPGLHLDQVVIERNASLDLLVGPPGSARLVEIRDNDALASLGAWPDAVVDTLVVVDNASLLSLAGLDAVRLQEELLVQGNPSLRALGSFANGSVALGVEVSDNDALPSLVGLGGISSVDAMTIAHNDSLLSVEGLDGISAVGDVVLTSNAALVDVSGLTALADDHYWTLTLEDDDALVSLDGLGLASLTDLTIVGNASLGSLAGLSGLEQVHRDLRVDQNEALTVVGLPALTSVARDLTFTDNVALPTSDIETLVVSVAVGGSVTISGNGE